MQKIIQAILRNELKEDIQSIKEIVGLGSVNIELAIKGMGDLEKYFNRVDLEKVKKNLKNNTFRSKNKTA